MQRFTPHLAVLLAGLLCPHAWSASPVPSSVRAQPSWKLEEADKVSVSGALVSRPGFDDTAWKAAVVPGTVLTSLVQAGLYPEPLYGENNRPATIPDSLSHQSWWYRTTLRVPAAYAARHAWLHLDGINYRAEVWVNGHDAGSLVGAFRRGRFDITPFVRAGGPATIAILVAPQPHPGDVVQHTVANGVGKNGGITAIDGPTFLATIGWDWMPGIPGRDTGIWQPVSLISTGPVTIDNPYIVTDLPIPRTDSAELTLHATLRNLSDAPQTGSLEGTFEGAHFALPITIPAHSDKALTLTSADIAALHLSNPRLWWPNGYGPQNLYHLRLAFRAHGLLSDTSTTPFGIRKVTYSVPDAPNLTITVNGIRIFIRGGDWGFDEALKRIPRARLDAQIHLHALAHLNMIRNWVGQSTSEDFYDLCDQYGILVWDEFFQPNPADGPEPADVPVYLANVRDKIEHFRNHPSIVLWCARNEGPPPPLIDAGIRSLIHELDPIRLYQPSSTDGRGVNSGGPYFWRPPQDFYTFEEAFKTEIGSVSIPTLDSIQGMMPERDWETMNDDWAQHDLARGNQHGDTYPAQIATRYGPIRNLADFARKGQLANYEAYRAMYEGRNAKLFAPSTGVLTWMSNPAQPSFVWQLYHYDLEPNASLFAVQQASELVHVQWNESDNQVQVINNLPALLADAAVTATFYDMTGVKILERTFDAAANPSSVADLGALGLPASPSPVLFLRLTLRSHEGELLSTNTYWRATKERDNLTALASLPPVTLDATLARLDNHLTLTLHNPSATIALLAHAQLRRLDTRARILPSYASANYLTLLPGESRTLTIDADPAMLRGTQPLLTIDGWNVTVRPSSSAAGEVQPHPAADPSNSPQTGLHLTAQGP